MSLASCKSFCILAFLSSSLHACAIILHTHPYSAVLVSTFNISPFFRSLVLKEFLIQPHCVLLCFQALLRIRILCFVPLIQSLSITARSPEFLYPLHYLPKGPYLPVPSAVEECFFEVHYAYSAVLTPPCSQYDELVIPFTQSCTPPSDFSAFLC